MQYNDIYALFEYIRKKSVHNNSYTSYKEVQITKKKTVKKNEKNKCRGSKWMSRK